ncbi:Uncharacterised protein [Mycobacteroides abscessus subsp. abscessus]|nr:Uncharacterised protein [Mycobacteroides abscessus subsp. abscessus]SLF50904.1 Uncharacterised protein [Mycobacteroides abscessus subsp. massiliense]
MRDPTQRGDGPGLGESAQRRNGGGELADLAEVQIDTAITALARHLQMSIGQ